MISRRTIYDSFIKYVNDSIESLTSDKLFYSNRLVISNNQLAITKDILTRNVDKLVAIYDISCESFNSDTISKIDIINKRASNRSNRKAIIYRLTNIDTSYGEHTILFIDGIVDNYFNVINEIKELKRKIQLITDKLDFFVRYSSLSRNVVYYILSQNNKFYEKAILNGETVHLGNHMGMIKVVPKKANGKVNWDESFAYRDKLVEEGKIPYNEADYLQAKAEGKPYDGIKWFIRYENDVQHYINWYAYSRQLPNKAAYTFKPARYNKSGIKLSELKNNVTSINEVNNLNIGIINKLNLSLDINELQFIKYANHDI